MTHGPAKHGAEESKFVIPSFAVGELGFWLANRTPFSPCGSICNGADSASNADIGNDPVCVASCDRTKDVPLPETIVVPIGIGVPDTN